MLVVIAEVMMERADGKRRPSGPANGCCGGLGGAGATIRDGKIMVMGVIRRGVMGRRGGRGGRWWWRVRR